MSDLTFSGNGKEIAEALGHLSASIAKKTTLPILTCVALEVRQGSLWATTTNLDQEHSMKLPVVVESAEGLSGCCVAMNLFAGVLGRCNGDQAVIALKGQTLAVTSAGRKATLATLPLGEFPRPDRSADEWFKIDGAPLAAAIRGVAFASSYDTTRYVLNGVHVSEAGELVATDGRRLASQKFTDKPEPPLAGIILPNAALAAITDVLGRNGRVEIAGDFSGLQIRAGEECFFTKAIEGNYPNFKQVVPNYRNPVTMTVAKAPLLKAASFLKLYRDAKDQSVVLRAEGDRMTLRVRSVDVGEAEETVALTRPVSNPIEMALRLSYLEEVVAREGNDYVILELEDAVSPLVIREPESDFVGVIMPIRLAA